MTEEPDINGITLKDIYDALEKLKEVPSAKRYFYYFTSGTGLPDDLVVDFFKDNGSVLVFTRDGNVYRKGERYLGPI